MATLKLDYPSWDLCNKCYTSMQRDNLEEQKLKGSIIPLAVLLGSHCNLGHHIYKQSFHFPNTPDCSWKSAQSLAQKQIKTKQVVMNYGAEHLTAEVKALLKYNDTNDCHNYTRIPTTNLPIDLCGLKIRCNPTLLSHTTAKKSIQPHTVARLVPFLDPVH